MRPYRLIFYFFKCYLDRVQYQTIKKNSNEFYIFNSFNDPFNCNEKQGRSLFNHLGGTLILRNDGHFTQKELPLLMTLLQQY